MNKEIIRHFLAYAVKPVGWSEALPKDTEIFDMNPNGLGQVLDGYGQYEEVWIPLKAVIEKRYRLVEERRLG